MDDLLQRLDDAANDTHYIDHITAREAAARIRELESLTRGQEEQLEIQGNELARRASRCNELGARIRELEAQVAAQSPAEVWRRAMEAAARAAFGPNGWGPMDGLAPSQAIRALPLPDDLR